MTTKLTTAALVLMAALTGCGGNSPEPANNAMQAEAPAAAANAANAPQALAMNAPQQFIEMDSANKMIGSYLNSIGYQQNDTDLRSLIFDADSLRQYLANPSVRKLKFMFAHDLDYINNGGDGKPAGYQSGKLTAVIAGFDIKGNYVFVLQGNNRMVLNHALPCPTNCPTSGTASSDHLQ